MTKASADNEKLKAQNEDLNRDINEIQSVIGDFNKSHVANNTVLSQLKALEQENKVQADSIDEKNRLLAEFANRIQAMKSEASGEPKVSLSDIKGKPTYSNKIIINRIELRKELDEVIERNTRLEDQTEKYQKAIEAQKKYIAGLNSAMELSETARNKMKQEIQGLSSLVSHFSLVYTFKLFKNIEAS